MRPAHRHRTLTMGVKNPKFLLMYAALQFAPEEQAKPDGSLGLAYLAAALRAGGYEARILDVAVGTEKDTVDAGFRNTTMLPTGLIRVGISKQRIAEEISDADVIGISSIFTPQTKMVFELFELIKEVAPDKVVIAGGVNARNLRERFFRAGADFIFLTESESSILDFAEFIRGKRSVSQVPGIAYLDVSGQEVINPPGPVVSRLDDLAMPAWDLLPLKRYWEIARPHGGQFPADEQIQYGSLLTSRGCPYRCRYCHISTEENGSPFGGIGAWRAHSVDRVLQELHVLKDLGVRHVFFEDDSLLANKSRAATLFGEVASLGLQLADVNGINIVHLMERRGNGLYVDRDFIHTLAEAGFKWLTLPFESASPRLIARYSTSKWDPERTDALGLIRACSDAGIRTVGNYMIGYPDETMDEIHATVMMARRHVDQGLNHALFFSVMPFPGTLLFDDAIAAGQLDPAFDTDEMKWTKSILRNTPVSAEALEGMRQLAWLTVNPTDYVDYKLGHRVARL